MTNCSIGNKLKTEMKKTQYKVRNR